jgi:hypothetical protein
MIRDARQAQRRSSRRARYERSGTINLILEILLSIFLHPIAMVLCWVNIAQRADLSAPMKFLWLILTIIWGIGPILYVLVGGGTMF